MGRHEMERVAQLIDLALSKQDDATLGRIRGEVLELTSSFPLYERAGSSRARVRRSA
jgi:glycine/serine hydroxymethyltransferase